MKKFLFTLLCIFLFIGISYSFECQKVQPPLGSKCIGDFDLDGDVDYYDLMVLLSDFGRTDCDGYWDCRGNFDVWYGSENVDWCDLHHLLLDYGRIDCGKPIPLAPQE